MNVGAISNFFSDSRAKIGEISEKVKELFLDPNVKSNIQEVATKKAIVSSALVCGVAYMGRVYLQINPLHATLFSYATQIATEVGNQLMWKLRESKVINGRSITANTFSGRLACSVISFIPFTLGVTSATFSLFQAITAIGLVGVCSKPYFIVAGK